MKDRTIVLDYMLYASVIGIALFTGYVGYRFGILKGMGILV